MLKRFFVPTIAVAALTFLPVMQAQNAPAGQGGNAAKADPNENIHLDGWEKPQISRGLAGKKPGPAPKHDLSGVWGARSKVSGWGICERPSRNRRRREARSHDALYPRR